MNIQVRIERLVVEDGMVHDLRTLELALVDSLSRALRERPLTPQCGVNASVELLSGTAPQSGISAMAYGQGIGHAVHAVLHGYGSQAVPTKGKR